MGDSKTLPTPIGSNTWGARVGVETPWIVTDASDPGNSSQMVDFSAGISARIAQIPAGQPPAIVLINIGTHDLNYGIGPIVPATWQSQYQSAIDAIHSAFPAARIYLTRPWLYGRDADSDTLAGWIATVIASRSTFTFAGDDERVWFKPNVATYSLDNIHFFKAAGQAAKVAEVRTVIGY